MSVRKKSVLSTVGSGQYYWPLVKKKYVLPAVGKEEAFITYHGEEKMPVLPTAGEENYLFYRSLEKKITCFTDRC